MIHVIKVARESPKAATTSPGSRRIPTPMVFPNASAIVKPKPRILVKLPAVFPLAMIAPTDIAEQHTFVAFTCPGADIGRLEYRPGLHNLCHCKEFFG
jgi:hypothetical protein